MDGEVWFARIEPPDEPLRSFFVGNQTNDHGLMCEYTWLNNELTRDSTKACLVKGMAV